MTVSQYLQESTDYLTSESIDSARLDVLILMEYVLGINRSKLLAEPNLEISSHDNKLLNKYIAQRAKHLPISYITNKAYFYGREYYVNSSVMQPRPESENIIELLKKIVLNRNNLSKLSVLNIADVGTGSGCLGISAALELPNSVVDLIDIDDKAIEVAKKNVVLHTISINTIKADILPEKSKQYDILLCNLPYLPDDFSVNLAAQHEPVIALFGGKDGLDLYRRLFSILKISQKKPLYILTESLIESHELLSTVAASSGYKPIDSTGLVQVYASI